MDQQPTSQNTQSPFGSNVSQPQKNKSRLAIAIVVLIVTIGLVGAAIIYFVVGGLGTSNQANETDAANAISNKVAEVNITMSGFTPQTLTIKAGQQVEFKNVDTSTHRLTSDNNQPEDFDTEEAIAINGRYVYVFDTPGTYHYYDPQNVNKYTGTITVEQ